MMNFILVKGNDFLDDFFIMDFLLEQEDWIRTFSNNPSYFKGNDLPVECISWYNAVDFCNKKSIKDGLEQCYNTFNGQIFCDFKKNG